MYEKWGTDGQNSSNKHICPRCGKRTFVRVIDTETGEYLPNYVGKCDREKKCGYCYTYAQYFREHKVEYNTKTIKQTGTMVKKEIGYINVNEIKSSLLCTSNLREFLNERFGEDKVNNVFESYRVGGEPDGGTIYWQIDKEGRVRTGKAMQYDRETGHRIKGDFSIRFIHSRLIKTGRLPQDWVLGQVLFGSHLIAKNDSSTICLVESEKTALICAILMPQYIWMATGGKNNFKKDVCDCLKGREVIIFPDLGAYEDWEKMAMNVATQVGFKYSMSQLLEENASVNEVNEGLDIADYLMFSQGYKK